MTTKIEYSEICYDKIILHNSEFFHQHTNHHYSYDIGSNYRQYGHNHS